MGELRLEADTIRSFADHIRAATGIDAPDMVDQVGSYLRAISHEGQLDEVSLDRAARILSNNLPHHMMSGPPGEVIEDTIGPERRIQLAILDRLAARLGVESEPLREAHERLAKLEEGFRARTPAVVALHDPATLDRASATVIGAANNDIPPQPFVPALWNHIFRPLVSSQIEEGRSAANMIRNPQEFLSGLSNEELSEVYLPLWYALNRARDEA